MRIHKLFCKTMQHFLISQFSVINNIIQLFKQRPIQFRQGLNSARKGVNEEITSNKELSKVNKIFYFTFGANRINLTTFNVRIFLS